MVRHKRKEKGKEKRTMRMTIDIEKLFRLEDAAYNAGKCKEEFKACLGKALYNAALKLNEFREGNAFIAIDGALEEAAEEEV